MSKRIISLPAPLPDELPEDNRPGSFLDTVHGLVKELYAESKDFRRYLNTIDTSDSVTGKFAFDQCLAAQLVQEKARQKHCAVVAHATLAQIAAKLNPCLKRHGLSRQQRLAPPAAAE